MTTERCCACEGHTLDRLLQPTVMALLAEGPQHGYVLVERLSESPLLKGTKPDNTGVYRLLKLLQSQKLVRQTVAESTRGPSKRVYELTPAGRRCLTKWTTTLEEYYRAVGQLVAQLRETETKTSK
jgi:DNA-binding PadR family transcriptional regulator